MNDEPQPASPTITERVAAVVERIRSAEHAAHRPAGSVRLIAASKTRSPEEMRAAYAAGVRDFGENYLQEAQDKQASLADLDEVTWHFIGACQSRKAATVASSFHWLHSLDRPSLLKRLTQRSGSQPLNVCVQVNISAEPQKAGVSIDELPALLSAAREVDALCLRGLMALPAPEDSAAFERLATLFHQHAASMGEFWDTLSMGMSGDLEAAIAAGATQVRIGTALFGPRPGAVEPD